jgi:hypothetical protein
VESGSSQISARVAAKMLYPDPGRNWGVFFFDTVLEQWGTGQRHKSLKNLNLKLLWYFLQKMCDIVF